MTLPINDLTQAYFTGVDGVAQRALAGSDTEGGAGGSYIIEITGSAAARTRRVFTGIYSGGYGELNRFVPPEYTFITTDGGYGQFGDVSNVAPSNIIFGYPQVTDDSEALIDRSNWSTNSRGVFIPESRMKWIHDFDAAPGGSGDQNISFVGGNFTIATFVGVDFNIFTNSGAHGNSGSFGNSHFNLGGRGVGINGGTSPTIAQINLYDCTVKFAQASASTNTRMNFYSSNVNVDGLTVNFGSPHIFESGAFSLEWDANNNPLSFDNVRIIDPASVNFGTNVRQIVITGVGNAYNYTINGLDARNIVLWNADAAGQLTLLNPVYRTIKAADGSSNANTVKGIVRGERTLKGTYTIAGENGSTVDQTVVRMQSDTNQSRYSFFSNGTRNIVPGDAVTANTDVTPATPIDANGAFSHNLLEYLSPSTNGAGVGQEGVRTFMHNKYNIIGTQHGYVADRNADYYLGGQVNGLAAFVTQFGAADVNTRTEFDPTGVDLGTMNLPADAIAQPQITTLPASQYTAAYRVTSFDDMYVALHNYGNIRTDAANSNRGLYAGIATSRSEAELENTTITFVQAATDTTPLTFSAGNISSDGAAAYRMLVTPGSWSNVAGGINKFTGHFSLALAGVAPDGVDFIGDSNTDRITLTGVTIREDVPTETQAIFSNCDFKDVELDISVPGGFTRYVRFNNCTGTIQINNTDGGALIVYDAPTDATFSGAVTSRRFINVTVDYGIPTNVSNISAVRWAHSVSVTNQNTPGTFSSTGFTSVADGNTIVYTFDVLSSFSGVAFNLWAGIAYDGFYEKAVTEVNTDQTLEATPIEAGNLDFSITDFILADTNLDLDATAVVAIADDTDKIVAHIVAEEGGTATWTDAIARASIRRHIIESNNYLEALSQEFIDEQWFTFGTNAIIIAETGRFEYTHSTSTNFFKPQSNIALENGTDQFDKVTDTNVSTAVTFLPLSSGVSAAEVRVELENTVESLRGSRDSATLTKLLQKVGGLY